MTSSCLPEDIQNVHRCLETGRSIYIGNLQAAKNYKTLKKYGIKAVVSVARGAFLNHSNKQLPNYLYIPALDSQDYSLNTHFEQTYNFIENNLKKTNVLVHCRVGISRSASIVIAYLIKKQKISFKEAHDKVYQWRPSIRPNRGFVIQLKQYDRVLNISKCQFNKQQKVYRTKLKTQITPIEIDQHEESQNKDKHKIGSLTSKYKPICIQQQLVQIQNNQMSLESKLKQLRQSFLKTKNLHNELKHQIDTKDRSKQCISNRKSRVQMNRQVQKQITKYILIK